MANASNDTTSGGDADSVQDQRLTAQQSTPRRLSPAAQRALAEAAARRAEIDARAAALAPEANGRKGPEPVRYGDWEIKGLASDF